MRVNSRKSTQINAISSRPKDNFRTRRKDVKASFEDEIEVVHLN